MEPITESRPSRPEERAGRNRGNRRRAATRPGPAPARPRNWRLIVFGLLCVVSLGVAVGYAAFAWQRNKAAARAAMAEPSASPAEIQAVQDMPHLLFLQTQGDAFRRMAFALLDTEDQSRYLTSVQCQRVHFAAGRGLCAGESSVGGAFTFDDDLHIEAKLLANGIPSRARVSPDGRYGSMTVFVSGHSYAEGGFSTATTLVDMARGVPITNLETFTVFKDGARWQSIDFNFWGVTFVRDSNRFYGTLGSGGTTYLVEGDMARNEMHVLRENVECPSLSPDETRLVFKKRMSGAPGPVVWRLHALDLATGVETPLAETRSVDDQAEWLDNQTVLYFLQDEGPPATIRPDLWAAPADGTGSPRLYQTAAFSPAVVR
jgi:hypothetical protein